MSCDECSDATPLPPPWVKVAADKSLSALLLAATSPLWVLIASAIALDGLLFGEDRGPVLYRETRISQGRPFRLAKFRILKRRAIEEGILSGAKTPKEIENTPGTLTRVGRLLKKTGLDELPQLVNVLVGDMSLVGPRPKPPPEYEAELALGIVSRKVARAGLTGPAQVMKGTRRSTEDEVAADGAYVALQRTGGARRILATDLRILARTVKVLLKMSGE